LASFNFAKNLKSIFDFAPLKNEITCLYGLKALTMFIIVMTHGIYSRLLHYDDNSESFREFNKAGNVFTVVATLSIVDYFFVFSAILMTRSILTDMEK
jgi:peptidoglycan/LPS O-acetylase OafA/YrhL